MKSPDSFKIPSQLRRSRGGPHSGPYFAGWHRIVQSPNNVRNEFYCRGWGLMICSATLGHDVRVSHKEPFDFSARFVAHDGELTRAIADELYQQFAAVERKYDPSD